MRIEDKSKMINILESYTDKMFDKYYITNPPILKKSDRMELGYGSNKNKTTNSINFVFKTDKPSELEVKSFIKTFVDMLEMKIWKIER